MTRGGRSTLSQNFWSLAPMQIHTYSVTEVTPVQPQKPGLIDKTIWRKMMSELISDKGVCRTAGRATPGLLITACFAGSFRAPAEVFGL